MANPIPPRAGNLQSGVGKLLKVIAFQEQEVQPSSTEDSDIPKERPCRADRKRCIVGPRCLTGATVGPRGVACICAIIIDIAGKRDLIGSWAD
jgi:hypothetical protein